MQLGIFFWGGALGSAVGGIGEGEGRRHASDLFLSQSNRDGGFLREAAVSLSVLRRPVLVKHSWRPKVSFILAQGNALGKW